MVLLGIDLGTSSVKVMLLDTEGQTLAISKANYAVLAPQPGWSESDPNEWWLATVSAARQALEQVRGVKVSTIGLSGQMHGVVLTNEEGVPQRRAVLWSDTRAHQELEGYRMLPALLRSHLANPLVPGMAGPLLCWLRDHEASAYQQARWAMQPKDWLRLRLTDEAATDPSDASATLLYDLLADDWADDVIAQLGLNRHLLPPIRSSGSLGGYLSQEAADALGLPVGLPVAIGAADTAAAAFGTGLLVPGSLQLTLGTGAQLIRLCSEPEVDQTGRTHLYRAADSAAWYAMAAVQNAGLALDWVRQVMDATWDEVYASATTVPVGAEGLLFLPYLTIERPHHPIPLSSGTFLGMRLDHRREHLLHAALEGVAFGIRVAFEALPGKGHTTVLRLAGGGSVSPAWRQMVADILNRELLTVDTAAASARGAALLGGIVSGVWPDAYATASIAPPTFSVAIPSSQRVVAYNSVYAQFLESIR